MFRIASIAGNDYNVVVNKNNLCEEGNMATLSIRKLDNSIKCRLRIQAANHGVSMEEEARCILRSALLSEEVPNRLGTEIHQHFVQAGGINEDIVPPRSMPRPSLDLSDTKDR